MTKRCGYIAIIGNPNAGKSTLLNQLVGGKVAIVSEKVQTTRTRITGITSHKDSQLIFMDTPGIFPPRKRLDRAMVHAAWEGVRDADLVALLVDVSSRDPLRSVGHIIEKLQEQKRSAVLVLNKIDLAPYVGGEGRMAPGMTRPPPAGNLQPWTNSSPSHSLA